MGRAPCCEKDSVKRGPWTPEEDAKLLACIAQHGTGSWRTLPKKAGLQRCGKSCRLRWTNYLRPDLKHGRFTDHEEQLIVKLHAALGSRWSLIAAQLPGRTDNDVKNYWNTRLKKKLCEMGIDPITHKPISQLLADLAGSIAIPKGGQIAEAALGCFKDDMLNVLMRKRPDWQLEGSSQGTGPPQQLLRGGGCSSTRQQQQQQQQWDPPTSTRTESVEPIVQKMMIKQGLVSKLPALPGATSLSEDVQQKDSRPEVAPDMLLLRGPSCFASDMNYYDPRPSNFVSFKPTAAGGWNDSEMLPSCGAAPSTSLGLHVAAQQQQQEQQVYTNYFGGQQSVQREESSPSSQVPESGEAQAPWSPSASGSSCSSTTLNDVSVLEGVLSSDVPLWDFSELNSII